MSDQALPAKINIGCGYDKRPGYLNVDIDPHCGPDVVLANNDYSVFPRGHFDEVLALDVLEHIPRLETLNTLLEWNDLLADGGRLVLKTSSILGVAGQLDKTESFRQQFGWTQCLFGTQMHGGDFHYTGFTERTLTVQLIAAGFRVERMWVTDHWLLHAEATKVEAWSEIARGHADHDDGEYVTTVYQTALRRDPEPGGLEFCIDQLGSGAMDRRTLARHAMGSVERLYLVAERNGFEPPPPTLTAERVARRIPASLKPALRLTRSTIRNGSERARRALGARKGRRAPV